MTKPLYSRKDIAQLLGVSYAQVVRNEKGWGLSEARADLNCRCVRFRASEVLSILKRRKFLN